MPHRNAKYQVASSKTRNKAGIFATNPKDINNLEENMDILEDWKLFGIMHDSFQNYVSKTIEWKAQEQLQHKAKQMQNLDEIWA
ncbi:30079_t:CDS:2 [Gigaspora margarita]|uniref:30079_t:CDS:1 n=1 Tax=Gigaspora margarita TaxID=4874 RepID=A0ABM8VZ90_GIGMA|nr:30079_t:CDS:2 [Gigaspora margarita]